MNTKYRAIVAFLVMLLIAGGVWAESADETAAEPPKNALLFRPGALLLGALSGTLEICVEYQRAFGEYFVLALIPDVAFTYTGTVFGVQVGGVAHPIGGGLKGFYIGLYPGVYFAGPYVIAAATVELGYQWVFASGFALALGGGASYLYAIGPKANLNISVGFAF